MANDNKKLKLPKMIKIQFKPTQEPINPEITGAANRPSVREDCCMA